MTPWDKLRLNGAELVDDQASNTTVLHVDNPHALLVASGYLKYTLASSNAQNVFYRGQHKLYKGLPPSIFRDIHRQAAQDKRLLALKTTINKLRTNSKLISSFPAAMAEPLLQHYGIRTTWVDLVDNVWVALWFACYRAYTAGPTNKYLHFEKRLPRREAKQDRFAYVVLVATDTYGPSDVSGLWQGAKTELVDLRIGVPSIFLRPHAQHGVLFRLSGPGRRELDYGSAVIGAIRADLSDAIDWLGEGRLLDVHALFPPPHYDDGYRILLKDLADGHLVPSELLGSVHHIGA